MPHNDNTPATKKNRFKSYTVVILTIDNSCSQLDSLLIQDWFSHNEGQKHRKDKKNQADSEE